MVWGWWGCSNESLDSRVELQQWKSINLMHIMVILSFLTLVPCYCAIHNYNYISDYNYINGDYLHRPLVLFQYWWQEVSMWPGWSRPFRGLTAVSVPRAITATSSGVFMLPITSVMRGIPCTHCKVCWRKDNRICILQADMYVTLIAMEDLHAIGQLRQIGMV